MGLSAQKLRGVLAFVADAYDVEASVPLTTDLLDRLTELVGCDYATYEELDWPRRIVTAYVSCSNEDPLASLPHATEGFWKGQCWRFSTHAALDKMSDRFDRRKRERLFKEAEYFDGFDVVDRLSVNLGDPRTRSAWLGFESKGRDFDERDRELALALRPHVEALWQRVVSRRRLAELVAALGQNGDAATARAIVLYKANGRIDHATGEAQRLLAGWFATPNGRLPSPLDEWAAKARPGDRYTERRNGSVLTVEAAGDFMLTLSERRLGSAELTPREREVLGLVAEGLTNAQIARRLWVAPSTVAKHLEQAYPKLGVHSRTAAVAKLATLAD